jgi:ABC-type glutathione transport system ATPase component
MSNDVKVKVTNLTKKFDDLLVLDDISFDVMNGEFLCIVGPTGCGKTTLSKQLLDKRPKGMPCMVYDINNEYYKYYQEPFDDFDVFLGKISGEEIRRHYILIEEATIFFTNQSNFYEMKNLLVRARHTGNIIQLNFHSFSSVPKGIYNLLDYVTVFKTNDNEKSVTDRFDHPGVLAAYKEAINSKDDHFYKTVSLY